MVHTVAYDVVNRQMLTSLYWLSDEQEPLEENPRQSLLSNKDYGAINSPAPAIQATAPPIQASSDMVTVGASSNNVQIQVDPQLDPHDPQL